MHKGVQEECIEKILLFETSKGKIGVKTKFLSSVCISLKSPKKMREKTPRLSCILGKIKNSPNAPVSESSKTYVVVIFFTTAHTQN